MTVIKTETFFATNNISLVFMLSALQGVNAQ